MLFSTPNGPLNVNQQNVANALTSYFNRNGGIPFAFAALNPAGLTTASGELPTASQQTTSDAMNLSWACSPIPSLRRGNPAAPSGRRDTLCREG